MIIYSPISGILEIGHVFRTGIDVPSVYVQLKQNESVNIYFLNHIFTPKLTAETADLAPGVGPS